MQGKVNVWYFYPRFVTFLGLTGTLQAQSQFCIQLVIFSFSGVLIHQIENWDRTHLNLKTSPVAYPYSKLALKFSYHSQWTAIYFKSFILCNKQDHLQFNMGFRWMLLKLFSQVLYNIKFNYITASQPKEITNVRSYCAKYYLTQFILNPVP